VFLSVASLGNPEDYDTMVRLHHETDQHEEKDRLIWYANNIQSVLIYRGPGFLAV
jgi:hypothetical protein